jgi:transketolase
MLHALHEETLKSLEVKANELRQDVITMLLEAGSGHQAGPLGMADVFTAFYFYLLNHRPKEPNWPDRDRLLLSNGHICPILYAALGHAGYFPVKELMTLRKLGTRLQGHPHRGVLPGIENTSGPLGSGLSQAVGMALTARMDGKKYQTYCLGSDGEHDAGNWWEAMMLAGKHKLSNLTVVIDRNNIQIDGVTEDVMPLEPLREKYEAFNWNVIDIDGHNFTHIIAAVNEAKAVYEKPTAIIAHTIPGKGVSFMESDFHWHSAPQDKETTRKALHELRSMGGKIVGEHE